MNQRKLEWIVSDLDPCVNTSETCSYEIYLVSLWYTTQSYSQAQANLLCLAYCEKMDNKLYLLVLEVVVV